METQRHTTEFKSMSVSAVVEVIEENNQFMPLYAINGVRKHINRECNELRDANILAMVGIFNELKKHNKLNDASTMYDYLESYAIQNNRLQMVINEVNNNLLGL